MPSSSAVSTSSQGKVNGDAGLTSPQDLWLDPWLTVASPRLSQLAESISQAYLKANLGVRRPKVDQVERVKAIVSAVIANLAVARSETPSRRVAVPMMHKTVTRYERRDFYQLPKVVRWMAEAGMIELHAGKRRQSVTAIEASGSFLTSLINSPLVHSEIGRTEGGERIILTARTGRDYRGNNLPALLIDYQETVESVDLRRELAELDAYLKSQRIELDDVRRQDFALNRRFLIRYPGALPTFDLHGRIYGAFWITLPKRQRANLTINGEPIADLDFASMFPRLAYAHAGAEPPEGDLYAIPGLEAHREGVKAGLSALFSGQGAMVRLPASVKDALPKGWTANRFVSAIGSKHPAIVPLFGRDIAMDFMATESQIMMTALQDLMRQSIPALPIHDGMMVGASNAQRAKAAMEAASLKVTGTLIPVTQTELPF